MPLTITVTPLRTFGHVIALDGSLDRLTYLQLETEIERLVTAGSPLIVLELSKLNYINSHGLRVIQMGARTMDRAGGTLKLLNPQPGVAQVFEIIQVASLHEQFANLDELDAFLDKTQRKTPPSPSA